MNKNLALVIAKKFISRTDAYAEQVPSGHYVAKREKLGMSTLLSHLSGERTIGHYVLSPNSTSKLMAFDIDLKKKGYLPTWDLTNPPEDEKAYKYQYVENLREGWLDRHNTNRDYYKFVFNTVVRDLVKLVDDNFRDMGVTTVASYTGSKGCHVYGLFNEPVPGEVARQACLFIMNKVAESIPDFAPSRGSNFFSSEKNEEYRNVTIEIYPKQDSIEDPTKLGNLLRLPLGKNRKSNDPTFFLDLHSLMSELKPRDPFEVLSLTNPWE